MSCQGHDRGTYLYISFCLMFPGRARLCSRVQGGPGACRQAGAAHAKSSPAFHKGDRSLKRSLGAADEQSGGVKRKLSFWKLFCLIIFGLELICRLLKCTKESWPDAFSVLCALAEPCKQAITLKVNFGLLILSLLLVLFPSPLPPAAQDLRLVETKIYTFPLFPYFFHFSGEKPCNCFLV